MEQLFDELVERQRQKLYTYAQTIIPHLTLDDLLQPNDFPALENHPHFRYEEGLLEGLLTARMAYLAFVRDQKNKVEDFRIVTLDESETCATPCFPPPS